MTKYDKNTIFGDLCYFTKICQFTKSKYNIQNQNTIYKYTCIHTIGIIYYNSCNVECASLGSDLINWR